MYKIQSFDSQIHSKSFCTHFEYFSLLERMFDSQCCFKLNLFSLCRSYDAAVELANLQWKMVDDSEQYAKFCKEQLATLKKQHAEKIEQIQMEHANEILAQRNEHAKAFDMNLNLMKKDRLKLIQMKQDFENIRNMNGCLMNNMQTKEAELMNLRKENERLRDELENICNQKVSLG